MKVGISTATFFTKVLTEDSFSVIKRLGADTCEVFLTTFYEYKDAFAQLLKERKGDFDVYSVHSLNTQFGACASMLTSRPPFSTAIRS